jgi:hypothetical protein
MITRAQPSAVVNGALTRDDFPVATGGIDRRTEPRVPCDKVISIQPCHSRHVGGFITVRLFDCSRKGLGVMADAPMLPREQFVTKLQLEQLKMVVYTVRHCRELGPNRYQIGAEFSWIVGTQDTTTPDAFLHSLLDNAHPSATDEDHDVAGAVPPR